MSAFCSTFSLCSFKYPLPLPSPLPLPQGQLLPSPLSAAAAAPISHLTDAAGAQAAAFPPVPHRKHNTSAGTALADEAPRVKAAALTPAPLHKHMSNQPSVFAVKATRVAAPQQPQQQQHALKPLQSQPAADTQKQLKVDAPAPRVPTPVQSAAPPPPPAAVADVPRGATPVNASRRTLVLKSYPELKKECEEMTAVCVCARARACVAPNTCAGSSQSNRAAQSKQRLSF